ncbi:MAG: radical SAM protein [Candidatus Zixiibacteriota bacterium]
MTGTYEQPDWQRILAPLAELSDCSICPHECGTDRAGWKLGFCQSGVGFSVASIFPHKGEEPVISGTNGICNVFFNRCNMQCVYCQNYEISRNRETVAQETQSLEVILNQILNALNDGVKLVGFVSPSHYIPQMKVIMAALNEIRPGLRFVFNNGGYDRVETIKQLEGAIAVYLPDLKYMDDSLARRYSQSPHYPEVAKAALKEMYRQKGSNLWLDDDGVAESGLIIRHLVLPGEVENSKNVLRFIADELSPAVHVSLMSQYWPTPAVRDHPKLGRKVTAEEYEEILAEHARLGFYRGWVQELDSPDHYRPQFSEERPFEE